MKKKNMKALSVCSLASLVISGSVISTTGVKAEETTPRLGGSDRYETAVKISQDGWKDGSDYVVLANGQGFADALCANPIAKSKDAPILLTSGTSLNSSTLAELKRLNAKHVIVVGGTGVVPTTIENTIKTQLNADVTRYGGADRYETSVKIAKALGNTSKIVLASGKDFADALSAGPAASIEGIPVILTQPDKLPAVTSDYIKDNSNITKTYVIGETGSVSAALYSTLTNPERFGGKDRFETNAKVIDGFKDDFDFSKIYLALGAGPLGNEFADSLTGGALAAKNKSALVITSSTISPYTTALLKDKFNTGSILTVLGGTGNITDLMVSTLKDAIVNPAPDPTPTPGPGDGATNITNDISKYYGSKIEESIENDPTLGKYYDVDTSNGITLTVKNEYKDKISNVNEIFENVDNAEVGDINTPGTIAYRVQKLCNLASEHINAAKFDGKTFKDFLVAEKAKNSKFSKYITSTGDIDVQLVAQKIANKDLDYDDYNAFIGSLKTTIKNSVNLTNPSPKISIKATPFDINRIDQNNVPLYDSSLSREENIDSILSLTNTVGTFTVYVDNGKSYFNVTINN
ncbi:cell wall-binding repeat-containing protein [Clostridium tyrobutyricum]|uniref:cell wall-binding repeat-containing protein n=1 Tax=Clostridium tyrobutyricum TaxID=1519 RepID=UPI00242A50B6|nr:cell wall-binding repeat-containing protein [Clostridium tyrobutyricum]